MSGRGAIIAAACATIWLFPAPAVARDVVVRSFDGTAIVAHFYPPATLAPGERAPTVLVGAGYPTSGDTRPDIDTSDLIGAGTLRRAGYNVMTWDARGLGRSGGAAHFNAIGFEGRDVQALLDFVATQPEALLDAPGDPRVGMSGSSYGGAVQLVAAALDPRIDAIVPDSAWNALDRSFVPEGTIKTGWSLLLCQGGVVNGTVEGLPSLQPGSTVAPITRACVEALTAGTASPETRAYWAGLGPHGLLDRIRVPTLILHGTDDTLFALGEAVRNFDALRTAGVALKMVWYCGGHGRCLSGRTDRGHVVRAGLAWLARWLRRDASADTGPAFEWLADDGVWRSGPDYPLAPAGALAAAGSGRLAVTPVDSLASGGPLYGSPASNAVAVDLPSPQDGSDVIGEPSLKLTYRGTAIPARTLLFAQIVDVRAGRVAGGQVTPIPVVLDGRARSVQRRLETIALRAGAASHLRLQVIAGSSLFYPQRSAGGVRIERAEATLPLVDATRSARPAAAAPPRTAPRRLRIEVRATRARGRVRLVLRSRLRSSPCAGTVTFAVRTPAGARTHPATISPATCRVRRVVHLRWRRGTRVRVSARFEGNAALAPRRAHGVTVALP